MIISEKTKKINLKSKLLMNGQKKNLKLRRICKKNYKKWKLNLAIVLVNNQLPLNKK